jgi:quercetin dioxygenase-like cupin family protein
VNRSEFEADMRREGYEVFYGGLQAKTTNPEHAHDWNARIMVIGGEIVISRNDVADIFPAGDTCSVAAGELHAEQVGPQGAAFIAGRRAAG